MKNKLFYSLTMLTTGLAQAAVFQVISDGPADGVADSTGGVRGLTNETPRSGYTTSDGGVGLAVVYVFEIPDLSGEVISSVDFSFTLDFKASSPTFNADLYGLSYRDASAIQGSDYYAGAYGGDPTDATALVDDVMTPSTGDGVTISLSDNSAFLSYVNSQITAGASTGDFLFLRLSPDFTSSPTGSDGYNVFSGDASSNQPILTLTTVPEPSAFALLGGLIAVGMVCLKRRR